MFESWSTHPNPGQELTVSGRGGLAKLWDDLAARGTARFPVKRLKPFGTAQRRQARHPSGAAPMTSVTVGRFIASGNRA